jgi:transcription elongation factor Elf1
MAKRKDIPAMTKKLIFQEANSRCPFCGEQEVTTLEIHHIHPQSEGGDDQPQNLILVCGNCHNKITNGVISDVDVFRKKIELLSGRQSPINKASAGNVITLEHSVNTGVIANEVKIKTSKKTVKIQPPSGTIAANRDQRNYIKYLIDRYNTFKKADQTVKKFSYGFIYKAIEREFRVKWDMISSEHFEKVAASLQRRIDKTTLGRVRKHRSQKNFSPFQEFLEGKHHDL